MTAIVYEGPERRGREATGERLGQFRCIGCGYGASCRIAPERCPMCGGQAWEYGTRQWSADLERPVWRGSTL
jgi:rubrerythrin